MTRSDPVAVIGAGLAGLACARDLAAAGIPVRIFDKGRAPGGRVATRRATLPSGAAVQFDHGAQYASARDPDFVTRLREAGAAAWPDKTRFVSVPRMSALARPLAEGLPLALRRQVTVIEGRPGAWMLRHRDAGAAEAPESLDGPFSAVAVIVPAPQAEPLIAAQSPRCAEALQSVDIAPCWTVMAAFPARLALPDWLRPGDGGTLGWAARDSAKPGRDPARECWVIQAGPDWSRMRLEETAEAIGPALLATLGAHAATPLPDPLHCSAHRWRYALVERPLGAPCLWDADARLGIAGDWCLEGRVESAWRSGRALAAAMRGA